MSCPTEAHLRAHLDEPDGAVAAHVADCAPCRRRADLASDNARFAATAIGGLDDIEPARLDVDAAHRAVTASWSSTPHGRQWQVPRAAAAAAVGLLVVALVGLTPTGRQAAADFLSSFRSERFQVVTFDPDQAVDGGGQLDQIVEVDDDGWRQEPIEVDDAEAAAAVSGFSPSEPTSLPDGATRQSLQAAAPGTVRLTLRADRAPDLPAALDGARVTVSVPGMVAASYDVGGRTLIVGEAGQLEVTAEGADLADIRAYLLDRPEVPDDLAAQLAEIGDWTTTVPIPVPVDEFVWRDTTVGEAPALMLSDPVGAGLLWQDDGRIHALGAEGLDIDVLRSVADGLR